MSIQISFFVWLSAYASCLAQSTVTIDDINDVREDIRQLLDESGNNRDAIGAVVRLIFHDCAGPFSTTDTGLSQCNGCIDEDNEDHAGLFNGAVDPLEEVFPLYSDIMNRADFWALAATLALEYAQELDESNPGNALPAIPYYFGRETCATSPDAADTKAFVGAAWGWTDIAAWFEEHVDFTERQVVAIMGAHTLGKCHQQFSGYSSIRWKRRGPDQLNNEYFENLFAHAWTHSQSPTGLWEWTALDRGRDILMLNADMSLVMDIDDFVDLNDSGRVACPSGGCPQSPVIDIAQEFADDNQKWLDEFAQVFTQLITTGYDVDDLKVIG